MFFIFYFFTPYYKQSLIIIYVRLQQVDVATGELAHQCAPEVACNLLGAAKMKLLKFEGICCNIYEIRFDCLSIVYL